MGKDVYYGVKNKNGRCLICKWTSPDRPGQVDEREQIVTMEEVPESERPRIMWELAVCRKLRGLNHDVNCCTAIACYWPR
jgi:hypothetical protein